MVVVVPRVIAAVPLVLTKHKGSEVIEIAVGAVFSA